MAEEDREKREKKTQVIASLSIAFVFFVIGLPLWWQTTKVYRAALPYDEIENLSEIKAAYLTQVSVVFMSPGGLFNLDDTRIQLLGQLDQDTAGHDDRVAPRYQISVRLATPEESSIATELKDNYINELDRLLWEHWKNQEQHRHYTFVILPEDKRSSELDRVYVGKHRHSILPHHKDVKSLISKIADVVKGVYVTEEAVTKAYSAASVRKLNRKHDMESMRAQKSVTGHQISLTLLNSNPDSVLAGWDIEQAVQMYLDPFLEKFPHLDFSVDSQILHYSSVKINPTREGSVHVLSHNDLPHMITPIEAKLGSHVSLHPSLNFIVYVPAQHHTPLHIKYKNGQLSANNAFLSPQWGGIMIYNVQRSSNDSRPEKVTLNMEAVMKRFMPQLKLLLGVKHAVLPAGVIATKTPVNAITGWEQDVVFRLKTMEYLATSTNTLTSLAQLLGKISNMVINDNIQEQVQKAVHSIHQCHDALQDGNLMSAVLAAKKAIRSSERAFFDPSILELLYFPDDQKYAIYIPLFLPICFPVLLSLMQGIKWLRSKEAEENENKEKED